MKLLFLTFELNTARCEYILSRNSYINHNYADTRLDIPVDKIDYYAVCFSGIEDFLDTDCACPQVPSKIDVVVQERVPHKTDIWLKKSETGWWQIICDWSRRELSPKLGELLSHHFESETLTIKTEILEYTDRKDLNYVENM